MRHLSRHGKSFLLTLVVVLLVAYTTLIIAQKYQENLQANKFIISRQTRTVDSSNWPTQTEPSLGMEFKYPTGWSIERPDMIDGYSVIAIKNPQGGEVRIYSNQKDYFALSGLLFEPTVIGNNSAVRIGDTIAAVKNKSDYITFDLGLNVELAPEFEAIVNSVKFK